MVNTTTVIEGFLTRLIQFQQEFLRKNQWGAEFRCEMALSLSNAIEDLRREDNRDDKPTDRERCRRAWTHVRNADLDLRRVHAYNHLRWLTHDLGTAAQLSRYLIANNAIEAFPDGGWVCPTGGARVWYSSDGIANLILEHPAIEWRGRNNDELKLGIKQPSSGDILWMFDVFQKGG
jgi:predicted alpha-1,6-mannanase (GH76 family)